jgi:hypothetical protein
MSRAQKPTVQIATLFLAALPFVSGAAGDSRFTGGLHPSIENNYATARLEASIESGRNTIFCGTFQLAWNRMKNDIIGEDIRLEKPLELVRHLNGGLLTGADISDEDYLAMAGYGSKNITDSINIALKDKFGEEAPRIDGEFDDEDTILAYAFFLKKMRFAHPFEDFANPLAFYWNDSDSKVEAFGIFRCDDSLRSRLRSQVEIIDYRDRRDFIVRLHPADTGDEIIIARIRPEGTLLGTYQTVNERITRSEPEPIRDKDLIMIPKLDFSIARSYNELLGLHLRNEGWEEYFVAAAEQNIAFWLDEGGAGIASEGIFAIKKGPEPDFRVLVCNGPFFLCCRKTGAELPYLAIWVGNSELLVRTD